MLPTCVTLKICLAPTRTDGWWLSQTNRGVAAQILELAQRLQVPDADRWAAGMLANAQRGGAADGAQALQAARMGALGKQLESPTQPAALSVQEIRQLASERAQAKSSSTAPEGGDPSGRRTRRKSASSQLTRARSEWAQAQPVLAGTTLAPGGQLSAGAVAKLSVAHQALAREVDLPAASIPRATAALKVLADHWTARIEREPDAFNKARAAQGELTRSMAPLRAQATQQRSLRDKSDEYEATIASIRVLEPGFDEARISAARVGEVTVSQLESSVPSRMSAESFAQLKLDVARRYLTEFQARATAAAAVPASNAVQSFIDAQRPELRKGWDMQLIGGSPLKEVVANVVQRGGDLTIESVDKAVRSARFIPPASFPEDVWRVDQDRLYEVRYDGFDEFNKKLMTALHQTDQKLPMQIRSPDGSKRLDIYRHGAEQEASTIIDQRNKAVPQPDGLAAAVADALGIKGSEYGALVVSYGSSDAVMADNPRMYTSPADAVRHGIETRESRSIVSTARLRRNIAERTSTPAQMLTRIEADYASLASSLDARRSALQPIDSAGVTRLYDSAVRLRDSPGAVSVRAGRIANEVESLLLTDRLLRGLIGENILSPEASRDSIGSGLTMISTILSRHGIPEDYSIDRDEPSLLHHVIQVWDALKWSVDRGRLSNLGGLDSLSQVRRVEIMSTPLRFLGWLSESGADWRTLMDAAEF